jgi:hypothetical protein
MDPILDVAAGSLGTLLVIGLLWITWLLTDPRPRR